MLGVPLLIVDHLLRACDSNGVASDEYGAELPSYFAVNSFFCLFEDDVDVNVECDEGADVLASVLEFYEYTLVACSVECV